LPHNKDIAEGTTLVTLLCLKADRQATSAQNNVSGRAASSFRTTAASIFRNDDPLAQALCSSAVLETDVTVRLDRVTSPAHDTALSLGSPTEDVFSAQDKSTTTNPISIGTSSLNILYKTMGKDRARVSNASSLSVACGSASEAEAQRLKVYKEALLGMGDWAFSSLDPD
jgi:hypothetical protein